MLEQMEQEPELTGLSALLLACSGDGELYPLEWIERLRPQVVLLSVSPGDRGGLPSRETLEAVEGYTLLRTDRNGWIQTAYSQSNCTVSAPENIRAMYNPSKTSWQRRADHRRS
jgi:hypothetical protein